MCDGKRIWVNLNRCDLTNLTIATQRMLIRQFGRGLFAMPALEMLLDLYMTKDMQPRSITALTAASSASERNSQRIIHRLAGQGLLRQSRDATDGRRILVELAPEGIAALDAFFDQMIGVLQGLQDRRPGPAECK